MKWGLETNAPLSASFSTFNCRSESLLRPTGLWVPFRNGQRCIVFAEGYYEWLKSPINKSKKTPYYVKRKDGQLLCMAGLWNTPKKGDYTFTVVTAAASEDLKWLHDRMPVMINSVKSIKQWVDPNTKWSAGLLNGLDKLQSKEELEWYEVSPEVGKVRINNETLNRPFIAKKEQSIKSFFQPKTSEAKTSEVNKSEADNPEVKKPKLQKSGTKRSFEKESKLFRQDTSSLIKEDTPKKKPRTGSHDIKSFFTSK